MTDFDQPYLCYFLKVIEINFTNFMIACEKIHLSWVFVSHTAKRSLSIAGKTKAGKGISSGRHLYNHCVPVFFSVVRKCGIKQTDLIQQPKLSEVLPRFVSWLTKLTEEVSAKTNKKYFPGTLENN